MCTSKKLIAFLTVTGDYSWYIGANDLCPQYIIHVKVDCLCLIQWFTLWSLISTRMNYSNNSHVHAFGSFHLFSNLLYELIYNDFQPIFFSLFMFSSHSFLCSSLSTLIPSLHSSSSVHEEALWEMCYGGVCVCIQFIKPWNSDLNFLSTRYKDSSTIFWAEKTQPIRFHWMPCRSVNSRSLFHLYLRACCE